MPIKYEGDKPYHQGWEGWRHVLEVILDGECIGKLVGDGSNRAKMEYGFVPDAPILTGPHPITKYLPKGATWTGLRAAKQGLASALVRARQKAAA